MRAYQIMCLAIGAALLPVSAAPQAPSPVASELFAEIRWAKDQLSSIDRIRGRLEEQRKENERLATEIRKLDDSLPEDPQHDEWLERLDLLASMEEVAIQSVAPVETIEHDGYQEIRRRLVLDGPADSIDRLGFRVRRTTRIATWNEIAQEKGMTWVAQSVFVAPPLDAPLRECRAFGAGDLASDSRAEELHAQLLALCQQLDEEPELRALFVRYQRALDWLHLVVELKLRQPTPTEDEKKAIEKRWRSLLHP